ncbi:hypothetical protein JW960_25065 [candidate division KSB1 bacterium]|nr:hypothetical protein [candidate division KSB1 bacterium]
MMKRKITHVTFFIVFLFSVISVFSQTSIELVESVPLETSLDISTIRNTQDVWLEMMNGANKTLDVEIFYLSSEPGQAMEPIVNAIKLAAERNVSVRIIAEQKFHATYPEPLESLDKLPNIEVRFIDFQAIAGGIMHAKYFIVDHEQVFLGSQNFDWRALSHIHELGIRMQNDSLVTVYSDVFEWDWQLADSATRNINIRPIKSYAAPIKLHQHDRMVPVYPVYSPRGFIPDEKLWDEPILVERMDSAQSEICIQLLSYSAKDYGHAYYAVLDDALRRAASRGVKVKLLCSDWSKQKGKVEYLQSLVVLPNIEVKLSTIPEYSGGFITYARVEHCKYMVVDRAVSWVGTGNWSESYFRNGRNVGVILDDAPISFKIHTFFENSWNSAYAYPLDPCVTYTPPRIRDASGR